jgi:hypothetical protein
MNQMNTLADTTELIETTTSLLMGNEASLTPQKGIELIDQWIGRLSKSETTQPIAGDLQKLKSLLAGSPVNADAIMDQMKLVAGKVLLIAPELGAEGEMPSLLAALATALRMGSE